MVVTLVVLGSISLPLVDTPWLHYAANAPRLDLALNTALSFAAMAIAVLAWVRYREGEHIHVLYQAGAFLGLFVGDTIRLVVVLAGFEIDFGMSLVDPGQTPIYLWTSEAAVAAVLLVLGGVATLRRWPRESQPVAIVVAGPAVLILVVHVLILAAAPSLPVIATPPTFSQIGGAPQIVIADGPSPLVLAIQLTIASLFLAAAILKTAIYERTEQAATAFLAFGLIAAVFAEVRFAHIPGGYAGLVSGWEILRALFYAILLVGVAVGARLDLHALHEANEELTQLRGAEARRAAFEERARLAREVHDGLVQDLWLARLQQARLTRLPRLQKEARQLAKEVDQAIEAALLEARRVLQIAPPGSGGGPSFADDLSALLIEFSDRFGLRSELTVEGATDSPTHPVRSELLSIVREALTNARKHADATVVRVRVAGDPSVLRVTIADDGQGFDLDSPRGGGFGLHSMRERAQTIGAELSIASRPGEGTVVIVSLARPSDSPRGQKGYVSPLDNGLRNR